MRRLWRILVMPLIEVGNRLKIIFFLHRSFWHFLLFRSSSRSCGVWHCKVVKRSSRDMAEHIYSKFPNHPEEPWVWSHWGRKTWMFVFIMWIWVNLDVKLIWSQILKVMTIEAFKYIYIYKYNIYTSYFHDAKGTNRWHLWSPALSQNEHGQTSDAFARWKSTKTSWPLSWDCSQRVPFGWPKTFLSVSWGQSLKEWVMKSHKGPSVKSWWLQFFPLLPGLGRPPPIMVSW